MLRFAEASDCRMAAWCGISATSTDAREACGICDFCDPGGVIAQQFREATEAERSRDASRARRASQSRRQGDGRLHSELFNDGTLDRRECEQLLVRDGPRRAAAPGRCGVRKRRQTHRLPQSGATEAGGEWDGSGPVLFHRRCVRSRVDANGARGRPRRSRSAPPSPAQ